MKITIHRFIQKHGDERVAEICGVTVRTAADWRRGDRPVHPKYLAALLASPEAKADGLTHEGVFAPPPAQVCRRPIARRAAAAGARK